MLYLGVVYLINSMSMKKAIVTGANGFIGSHLINELLAQNIKVIAVVKSERSNIDTLVKDNNLKVVYCDLAKILTLTQKITDRDIDIFYHFAWSGSAGNARFDEVLQVQNALWTANCVRVAKDLGCTRFVGAGSIMEKETISAVFTQENQPGMGYLYGVGKLTAHCISKAVAAKLDIEFLWGIITNAYGPGEISPRFVNTTIRKIIKNEPLQFTAATQNYDFVYITDVAKAFYYIGLNGKPFCNYIIGSSKAKQLKDFILEMKQTLSPNGEFHFGDIPFTGIDMPISQFNTEKTEKDTGFKAKVTFKEGVYKTSGWLKELEDL